MMRKRGYRRTEIFAPRNNNLIIEALEGVDIVFCESLSTLVLRVMMLRSRGLIKSKIVFHAHTMADRYLRAWFGTLGLLLDRLIIRPSTRFCIDTADKAIAPSVFFAKHLERTIRPNKSVEVWSAPVELPEEMIPYYAAKLGVGQTVLRFKDCHELIGVVNGRVGEEKKSAEVVKLVLELRRLGVDAGIVFVGGGEIEELRKSISAADRKHFLFTGNVDRWLGIAISDLCDFGLSLAETETQGLSVLEQMLRGLCVIVRAETVMEDYVRKSGGGYVLRGESFQSMALEMRNVVCQDRERLVQMGQNGKDYVSANFSEEGKFAKLRQMVEEVLI
jgi:glycosyltransferase involved in cell wall biosynthesis